MKVGVVEQGRRTADTPSDGRRSPRLAGNRVGAIHSSTRIRLFPP